MTQAKTALVVGATGVVGRNLLRHLLSLEDWRVIAVSRRRPDIEGDYRHISVDLLDADQTRAQLGSALGVTHIFYAAYVERGNWAETVAPNLAMLANLMEVVEAASPDLRHVNLMHGTKWYGSHLGPFKTPSREDDPRHMPPNFYFDQQDFIAERQKGKAWSWSSARPHATCGFALGNPMNLVMVLAVYATISKALGLPLRHPGSEANAAALYQVCDTDHLAKAVLWMAEEPRCANEPFNITNGDIFRWRDLWPDLARFFEMETAPPQKIDLAAMMADKGALWERIVERHGLEPIPFDRLVSWAFGDFVFKSEYDIVSSTTKARQYGFHDVIDSRDMFLRQFAELRAKRIIP